MLNPKQKAFLKGLAHPLQPTVRIGRGRLSPEVIEETRRTMTSHELIKVRIDVEDSSDRKELAAELAHQVGAELVGTIGKIAMLYRPFDDEPEIALP